MTFVTWLDTELFKRGINRSDLARLANIHHSTLSHIYSGRRKPGYNLCIAIAKAMDLSQELVLEKAGLIPTSNETELANKQIQLLFSLLNDNNQEKAIEYLEFLKSKQDLGGAHAAKSET